MDTSGDAVMFPRGGGKRKLDKSIEDKVRSDDGKSLDFLSSKRRKTSLKSKGSKADESKSVVVPELTFKTLKEGTKLLGLVTSVTKVATVSLPNSLKGSIKRCEVSEELGEDGDDDISLPSVLAVGTYLPCIVIRLGKSKKGT